MRGFLIIALIGWAVAFFGSFMAFYLTPAKDFGLAAGWNKVGVFITWQSVATVLAFLCLVVRWSSQDAVLRKWAAVPSIGFALLFIAFCGFYFWATSSSTQEPAYVPPKPVTGVDS